MSAQSGTVLFLRPGSQIFEPKIIMTEKDNNEKNKNKKGTILSENLCVSDISSMENDNVLVIGGSGGQRAYNYIAPNIMRADCSYVITDTSDDLYKQYAPFLRDRGYNVKCLDLINPKNSDSYNPFVYFRNEKDIEDLARAIISADTSLNGVDDPFHEKAETALLIAVMTYLYRYGNSNSRNMHSVAEMLETGIVSPRETALQQENHTFKITINENLVIKTLMERIAKEDYPYTDSPIFAEMIAYMHHLFEKTPDYTLSSVLDLAGKCNLDRGKLQFKTPLDYLFDDLEKEASESTTVKYYKTFKFGAGQLHDNIICTSLVRLRAFADKEIARLTSSDNMELDLVPDQKTAVFVITPPGRKRRDIFGGKAVNTVAAMMCTQLMARLLDYGENTAGFSHSVLDSDGQVIKTYRASSQEESDRMAAEADKLLEQAKESRIWYDEPTYQHLIIMNSDEIIAHKGTREEAERTLEKIKKGTVARNREHSLPVRTKIVCNGYCDVGFFPKTADWLAKGSQYGISFSIIAHSLALIQNMYKNKWDEIVSMFGTILYLGGGCEHIVAEWFAGMIFERPMVIDDKEHAQVSLPAQTLFSAVLAKIMQDKQSLTFSDALTQMQTHFPAALTEVLRTLSEDKCVVISNKGAYLDSICPAEMPPCRTDNDECGS